ncbi:hypothetical protein [Blattabacterium cuenoti]|uniref:hypothetical protein n=1 Tax=Blattabacterium cuenoti TaxID=1653831 RepID=UPI00163D0876|nr:hypothetical protein [Blattabacterium cuenoti]
MTKKVQKEKYLLTKNVFIINGKKVYFSNLENYVKQKPNKKILNLFPVKLIRNKKVLNHLY